MPYFTFTELRTNKNLCEIKEFPAPIKGVNKGESDDRGSDVEVIVLGKAVSIRTGRNLLICKSTYDGSLITAAAHHIAINGKRQKS